MSNKEVRTFDFSLEVRDDGEAPTIQGHAAVFNQEAEIMGFREQIAPGAFTESIKKDDIRALFNHDPNFVLGRNTADTLSLEEDKTGLRMTVKPPNTQFARDLMISIKRGDISQQSFGFQVLDEEWTSNEEEDGKDLRTIKRARLFDVSPVTFPAYEGTDVAVRSHDKWQEEQRDKTPHRRNLKKRKLALRRKTDNENTR